jgi:hypothetical protein
VGYFRAWRYMQGLVEGTTTLGDGVRGYGGWPLKPGDYEIRMCLDDSYRCRVSAPFTVTVIAANLLGDGVPGVGDLTDQDFALFVSNARVAS